MDTAGSCLPFRSRLFSFPCFAQRFSDLLPQDGYQDYCYPKTLRVRQISGYRARSFHDCEPHRRFFMFRLLVCRCHQQSLCPLDRRGLR